MRGSRFVVVLVVSGLFVWFFGSALFLSHRFNFRDASHYYYPLFEWTAQEWGAGRIPLWNPYDNLGTPIHANPTASIFYPGKLIFALNFLDFGTRFNLYVAGHLLLAAGTTYFVARRWKASCFAAGLASISYAFSGSVLFQYCNVVYLVGAAWLPLSLLFADRLYRHPCMRNAIWLGGVLALMILGGDPQIAYHAFLLAALLPIVSWRLKPRDADSENNPAAEEANTPPQRFSRFVRFSLFLLFAGVCAGMLSAVQLLPSIVWGNQSDRATFRQPRSVYEIPHYLRSETPQNQGGISGGLFGEPDGGFHHEHIYHFSIGPWRLAEFVWPNVFGRMFPENERWISALPAEGRIWTPSMYMGILPVILAMSVFNLRSSCPRLRWLSWILFVSIVASFGWYGIGWLVEEIRFAISQSPNGEPLVGQPVGGLYWALVTFAPGYVNFRYPAKWMVVASLASSLIAAHAWDRQDEAFLRRLRRLFFIIPMATLVGIIVFLLCRSQWTTWLASAPADPFTGPLNISGAQASLYFAAAQASLMCLLFRAMFSRWKTDLHPRWSILAIALTAIDIGVGNGWLVSSVSANDFYSTSDFASQIRDDSDTTTEPMRFYREANNNWLPNPWRDTTSRKRLNEARKWEIDTLHPKHHLSQRLKSVNSPGTIRTREFISLFLATDSRERPDSIKKTIDLLGAEYLSLPTGKSYPQTTRNKSSEIDAEDANLFRNESEFPRAWIVHDVRELPTIESKLWQPHLEQSKQLFADKIDLMKTAFIEGAKSSHLPASVPPASLLRESCEIVSDEPGAIDLKVNLAADGLIVLSETYSPDWQSVTIPNRASIHIFSINRTMIGVKLPAGEHHVSFRYRPKSFYSGITISIFGWLAAAVFLLATRRSTPVVVKSDS